MRSPLRGARLALAALLATAVPPTDEPFRDVAPDVGLRFEHVNGAAGRYLLPEIMGAGGALLDYDGDGDLDALLVQGRSLDPGAAPADGSGHRLFRNDLDRQSGSPGRPNFVDVTAQSGLSPGDYGMGATVGDYDNDGDADVYLSSFGPNRLYRNDGHGVFADVTASSGEGLDDPRWTTSAAFADYDGDGDLDLFIANYVDFAVSDNPVCHDPVGVRDYCGPLRFRPAPDRLFANEGNGRFRDVTEAAGLTRADGAGLGVAAADFNGDGRLDFYVANDASANQLWLNKGDGTFADGALLAGVALNMDGQAEGSMGLAIGDPDNDGDVDIFVTNITGETHAFYRNLGDGAFEDARLAAGLSAPTAPYTGFGTNWLDYDSDGFLDLFIANGAVTLLEAVRGQPFPFRQPSQLFKGRDGTTFDDVSAASGPALRRTEVSRGVATGDVDNDGDVDLLLTANGGPARLLLNQIGSRRHWLSIRLKGRSDNRQGLGARVGLRRRNGTVLWRQARTDGSYLSSSDPRVHFGLGFDTALDSVEVVWPSGRRETWPAPPVDTMATLVQGTGKTRP
jgi:hypothetical protein